jgi:hypothetical protein
MFQDLIDIITTPSAAFARLKEKPTIWFPLLLVLVATVSVQVGYILLTDKGFLVDQQIDQVRTLFPNLTAAQVEQMRNQMMNQGATASIISSAVSVFVIYTLIIALYALYLKFVSKFSFVEFDWKHWMSLICWTSIPTVFGAIASWIVLLTNSNGQVPMLELNVLSFSNLLGLSSTGGPLLVLTPLYIWSFVLLALGYQNWTKKSLFASVLLSLGPYLLIFGLWGFFSM